MINNEEFPSVPPGFESFAPFSLKRINESEKKDIENRISCSVTASPSNSQSVQMETDVDNGEVAKRSVRRRQCINHGRNNKSEDESDSDRLEHQNCPPRSVLPKGVVRGCPQCSNCQKVSARWHPLEGQRRDLQNAPVFRPTEEEFKDTLKYIASIRAKAEPYGICRIVPPSSWRPPCPLKEKPIWSASKFSTRVQRVDKLQNRDSMRKVPKSHREPQQPSQQGRFRPQPPRMYQRPYAPPQWQQNQSKTMLNQAKEVEELKKQMGQMAEFIGQFKE
nr:putative lysine-specific demethylase JMJ16 [Malus domestica]